MLDVIKGKVIVSCQALEDEPLHSSFIMGRMAKAAKEGGAVAIRAQSKDDIIEIKKVTDLPVIGLVKRNYENSEVYITATKKEVDELLESNCEMIALDSTLRERPKETLKELYDYIHSKGKLIMADISTLEEGINAYKLGADCISTTLSGYTKYSPQSKEPDFNLISDLIKNVDIPVIGEGRLDTPELMLEAYNRGAYSVVVGSAITRPQLITKKFTEVLKDKEVS
ncbi:putative N-acetylmannosamine-6-phosphate 2-epimerase [Clostridium tertium]|uniref:Putative N-acetylmannosamine-6-phosphate 2-epimerase n=1 Tax=Clostridium tertium TaxID=1559 RepID=A0A6N3GSS7_9CLOT